MSRYLTFIVTCLVFVTQAVANEREDLEAAIVVAATHEDVDERHTVEIDDCLMTTFRWRDTPEHGWVLWTSFQFDMRRAQLQVNPLQSNEKFFYSMISEGPPEMGFGIVLFEMDEGLSLIHI